MFVALTSTRVNTEFFVETVVDDCACAVWVWVPTVVHKSIWTIVSHPTPLPTDNATSHTLLQKKLAVECL